MAIQNALNSVWEVPQFRRPRFPANLLRSLGMIAVLGARTDHHDRPVQRGWRNRSPRRRARQDRRVRRLGLLLNIGLFWLAFRLATAAEVTTRDLRLGAILAAIAWQLLQLLGGLFVSHLSKANAAYGTFGVVLGLLAWFYLQAQITLYIAELTVVRARQLWPRALAPPPLTAADLAAYQLYAEATQRRPELEIVVRQVPQPRTRPASPAARQ